MMTALEELKARLDADGVDPTAWYYHEALHVHGKPSTAVAEYDWVVTQTYKTLHCVRELDDAPQFVLDAMGSGITQCGVRTWLYIPGIFTRMGAPRCKRCCQAVGFPQGTGSPKNDPSCRELAIARVEEMDLVLKGGL